MNGETSPSSGESVRSGTSLARRAIRYLGSFSAEVAAVRLLLRRKLADRMAAGREKPQDVVDRFHELLYNSLNILVEKPDWSARSWVETSWFGAKLLKCPFDLWVYQEILYELRPSLIVECGTAHGGSAYYLASLCDLLGHGRVVTIDVREQPNRPSHSRITYLTGSSVSPAVVERVKAMLGESDTVLVILDSDHSKDHVLQELTVYSPLVSVGSYVIVEDSNINGHPVEVGVGPGPMEAIDEFLANETNFVADRKREKFLVSFNPRGYLRRVS